MAADLESSSASMPQHRRGRLLLLEDDQLLAKYFRQLLLNLGALEVAIAYENSTAIKVIEDSNIDAAFIDYRLEFETSEKTAHFLKERNIPFVFLSGRSLESEVSQTFPEAKLLVKPAKKSDVRETLATWF